MLVASFPPSPLFEPAEKSPAEEEEEEGISSATQQTCDETSAEKNRDVRILMKHKGKHVLLSYRV